MTKAISERGTAANGRVTLGKSEAKQMIGAVSSPFRGDGLQFHSEREPIMWLQSSEQRFRGNNARRHPDGKIERLPSVAHSGDSDYIERKVHPRAESRYWKVLTSDGNIANWILSNGASVLPTIIEGKYSRDEYAQLRIAKLYQTGGIPLEGECLIRLVADGRVRTDTLLVDLAHAKVCKKGASTCKHIDAEREARLARSKARNDEHAARTAAEDPSIKMATAVARALAEHEATRGSR